ncbi:SHOCT domain-containing protein [Halorussus halobius]|uniref:SHOCT domain-containing protein n=1 Tax=Halorussus halobius TaxID=1710537 RepID=UPI0010918CC3|nr:SHOCT domain-containing protein [Halorussus halobius]
MDGPPLGKSNRQSWHELVEHYTPDGWLGRLLLAAATGTVGGTALFLAFFVWPILAPLAAAVGLAGVGLALVALWPVYLSLIGNVESASAYPVGGASRTATDADSVFGVDATDSTAGGDADDSDDAVELLKRRYAAGDITEEEFERRVDDLLDADAALDSSRRSTGRARERERN